MNSNSARKKRLMTVEEYLLFEERSKYKHEYIDGEVIRLHESVKEVRLAGNRASHIFIVSNICFYLRLALKENKKICQVGTTEMRIRMRDEHYAYPDIFAVCGELSFVPDIFDTLENPAVIFEVLSKSTELRDRGEKAIDYRNLPSLTDYILVSQNTMRIEQQSRRENGIWNIIIFDKPEDKVFLESLECEISVGDIYENIKFPPKPYSLKLVESKKKNGKHGG